MAPIVLTGAEGDASAVEAFGVVEATYGAFNTGDVETWVNAIMVGLSFADAAEGQEESSRDAQLLHHSGAHGVGETITVEACEYSGHGEWPGTATGFTGAATESSAPVGHRFECATVARNAFHGAGGIELRVTHAWVVEAGEVQAMGLSDLPPGEMPTAPHANFRDDFMIWLFSNHPDVEIAWAGFGGYPTAEDAALVLDLVDDFVAESPRYPLDG